MNVYIAIILMVILGYLFGSINWGLVIGKVFYKKDIRLEGSKNAGATNAGRVLGKHVFFIVALSDISKGILAFLIGWLIINNINVDYSELPFGDKTMLPQLAALSGFIGHIFPIYFKFKGGKGVTTGFATAAVTSPILAVSCIVAWGIFLVITKMMSLASILIAIVFATLVWTMSSIEMIDVTFEAKVIASTAMFIIVVKHHANIKRLLTGNEKKMSFKS